MYIPVCHKFIETLIKINGKEQIMLKIVVSRNGIRGRSYCLNSKKAVVEKMAAINIKQIYAIQAVNKTPQQQYQIVTKRCWLSSLQERRICNRRIAKIPYGKKPQDETRGRDIFLTVLFK